MFFYFLKVQELRTKLVIIINDTFLYELSLRKT